jgi:hypothetical protein
VTAAGTATWAGAEDFYFRRSLIGGDAGLLSIIIILILMLMPVQQMVSTHIRILLVFVPDHGNLASVVIGRSCQ